MHIEKGGGELEIIIDLPFGFPINNIFSQGGIFPISPIDDHQFVCVNMKEGGILGSDHQCLFGYVE